MKKQILFMVHAFRVPKLTLDAWLKLATDPNYQIVIGVDSASSKEFDLFEEEIKKYEWKNKGEILGIHAVTGTYHGKTFDNSKKPNCLSVKGRWCLMRDSRSIVTKIYDEAKNRKQ